MYFRRKSLEVIPQEETKIWTCADEACTGWIRDNFAFAHVPVCFRCQSPMVSSLKLLPTINNSNVDIKGLKKGTLIS